ncbi:ribonuclease E inhibitor RraB [Massilia glaciei]|uniref:Ribonuclease E inhibitor RraB n=1 Tax=Massilia glaciei TaxID=1524097 RepID=A0A2U2HJK9_9BURK|nr:ribonuclease E inhibitor RraB [Massilia glaciei]PWF47604.1 ribonuclease E inhibitor RraB [Massilia glaciei]
MERDCKQFPYDENGDVLLRMKENGDNLSKSREIDFSVIFPTEDAALKFAIHLLKNDQKVSFSSYDGDDEMPWQVAAHPFMEPTHENITGYENQLGDDAATFGGRNDGWGSMQQD